MSLSLSRSEGIDVTNFNSLSSISESIDCIIHLAAKTFIPESFEIPREYIETNVQGTTNVLEFARLKEAKVIFLSTYVYGPPQYLPVDEKHPVNFYNPYSTSKLIAEHVCQMYNKMFDLPIYIIRPFNIYGKNQASHFLIPKIIEQSKTGKVQLIDPRPKRDFIHIDDLVDLVKQLTNMDYKKSDFQIYNAGLGKSYSIQDVVRYIREISENDFEVSFSNEYRKNEVLDLYADISKAKSDLSWTPKYDLKEGLREIMK